MGMGIMRQDDAINTFMLNFVLDLDVQILKCLTVTCVIHHVMILLEYQCQGSVDVPLLLFRWIHHLVLNLHQLSSILPTDPVDCCVLHRCLPVCLPSQVHSCAMHSASCHEQISVEGASYFPVIPQQIIMYIQDRGLLGCDPCVVICLFCVQLSKV